MSIIIPTLNSTNEVLLTLGLFDPSDGKRACLAQNGVFESTPNDIDYMSNVIAEYESIRVSESLDFQLAIFPLDTSEPVLILANSDVSSLENRHPMHAGAAQ